MPRTVGIDLGTSFSLVAYIDKTSGRANCVPGPYGETRCPPDGVVALGAAVQADILESGMRIEELEGLVGQQPIFQARRIICRGDPATTRRQQRALC